MIIIFCEPLRAHMFTLSSSFEDEFTKYGVRLCDGWTDFFGQKGDADRTFIFSSPGRAFKVLAIYLFKQFYCPKYIVEDYDRSEAVKYLLSIYENFTEEKRCQCDVFLTTLLDKPNGQPQQEDLSQSSFIRFLHRIYNQLPAPLFSVMRDNLPENQTLFLIDTLAYQYSAADVNCTRRNIDMEEPNSKIDKHEVSKQHSYSLLLYACWFIKSPAVVRLIIEKSPTLINKPGLLKWDHSTVTPIHVAAARGDVNVLQVLLDKGADITLTNNLGDTPLHLAQIPACVRLLIKAGADIHAVNRAGATALHAACDRPFVFYVDALPEVTKNNSEKIRLLIRAGARVNQQDHCGNTPLHYAVRSLFKEPDNGLYTRAMIVALCENGANPNAFNDESGIRRDRMPPLLYLYDNERIDRSDRASVLFGHKKCEIFFSDVWLVAQLLLHYGADPAACSFKGKTILHRLHKINDAVAMAYFLNITSVKALVSTQKPTNPHAFWQQPLPKTERLQTKDDIAIVKRYG